MLPFKFPSNSIFLDTALSSEIAPKQWLFTNPIQILTACTLNEVEDLLALLDEWTQKGYFVAGYWAYEAGFAFEEIGEYSANEQPLGWFGVYEMPIEIDVAATIDSSSFSADYRIPNLVFDYDEASYKAKIDEIRHIIHEGEVYQINFTGKLRFDFEGDAWAFYRHLRQKQRVSYGAFIQTDTQQILCFSPELFFKREGNTLSTRPMKGTMQRGRTVREDAFWAAKLREDAKNRAENLMIVDLLRNDLSVICEPNSVQVTALFTTEMYDTLIQMTSTVEGTLREKKTYSDMFKALFPCGSVTGAPKIRAMQHIHRLEQAPRGVYCGAIGYISPHQEAVFNVGIRTIVLEEKEGAIQGEMGVGSGIVWDSDADAEFAECQLKAQFLTNPTLTNLMEPPFKLIEAIAFENDFHFLDQHFSRLQASAQYFRIPFQPNDLKLRLDALRGGLKPEERYKIRVLLGQQGKLEVEAQPYTDFSAGINRVKVSEKRVDAQNPFYHHKTTRRAMYESEYQQALAEGFREVIFENEQGFITEGSRTNIFIEKDGIWRTPPLDSGALAGVYRQHLLDTLPHVEEQALRLQDLLDADAVYCCNVLRGLEKMELPAIE
jgi:para-aminobenzoate synthetase/4-amino-4-deoxychorismate lyase